MAPKNKSAPKAEVEPEPVAEPEPQPQASGQEDEQVDCIDKIDESGHGVIWYPSGNLAVNISIGDVSKGGLPISQAMFMANSATPTILVSFDHNGEGFVNYADGRPWLIVSRLGGYQLSDANGNIEKKGTWPRKDVTPIICQVNESIRVEFIDRQNITVSFEHENVHREFQVGEKLKRTSTYLEKSTGTSPLATLRGKHELDVNEIRREQGDNGGSLYHRAGPHATKTKVSGVGVLRTLTKEIPQESEAMQLIRSLDEAMHRMRKVNTMPAAMKTSKSAPEDPLEDMGKPPLTESLKTLRKQNFARQADLKSWYNLNAKYDRLRRKVPAISIAQYREVTATNPPSKVLVVICFHADWSPMSRKHSGQIELAWGELSHAAAKDALCSDAMIHVYRLDASEGGEVQERYQFRTVPMYLHFYDGNLVAASNTFRGKDDFLQQARQSQEKGARGTFLPETFAFGLKDNSDLDFINPNMSLLLS